MKKLGMDWYLNFVVIFLLSFGLIAIFSLSANEETAGLNNFHKQIIFIGIGLLSFVFLSFIDYRGWKKYSGIFYLAGIILLSLIFWLGKDIRGTYSWFDLGFFNFQPTELFKFFVIIILAKYFSKSATSKLGIKEVFISFLYIAIPVFLIMKQPDLGGALIIIVIWLGMLFVSNVEKKVFGYLLLILAIFSLSGWFFVLKDYQKNRIEAFINPMEDPLGAGYNVIQSTIAIGSGGLMGKGLGYGSQSQLNFLPEKHNDFIFATIAEESGFLGLSILIAFFGFLLFRLFRISESSRDLFGHLIVSGIMTMFFFQILINAGMNLGIMPVAGLSLPFVSYGGSFLLVCMLCIGMAQSVWRKRRKERIESEY